MINHQKIATFIIHWPTFFTHTTSYAVVVSQREMGDDSRIIYQRLWRKKAIWSIYSQEFCIHINIWLSDWLILANIEFLNVTNFEIASFILGLRNSCKFCAKLDLSARLNLARFWRRDVRDSVPTKKHQNVKL